MRDRELPTIVTLRTASQGLTPPFLHDFHPPELWPPVQHLLEEPIVFSCPCLTQHKRMDLMHLHSPQGHGLVRALQWRQGS